MTTEPGTDPEQVMTTEPETDPEQVTTTEPETDPGQVMTTEPGTDPGTDPGQVMMTDPQISTNHSVQSTASCISNEILPMSLIDFFTTLHRCK